jgi:hypothetical protein
MHLPTLSPRAWPAVAAIACAAALIPVAALAPPPPRPHPPRGQPAGLAGRPGCVWISNVQGAAGTFYYTLNFTNLSGHACTLRGHPGVSTVNLSGNQIGRPARWGNPGNAVTRAAHGQARPRGHRDRGAGDHQRVQLPPKACRRVTAAGLRVYPPNQFTSTLVPYPIGACTTRQIFMTAGVVQRLR